VLEDRPEAFRTGVVETRSGGAHGADEPNAGAKALDLVIAELASAIGVEGRPGALAEAGRCRSGKCSEDDLGAHVVGELVAEDPGRALVANRAEVGLPVADREIRDVRVNLPRLTRHFRPTEIGRG